MDLPLIQNPEGDTLAEVRDSRAFSNELRHDRDGKRIGGKSKPHHEEPNTDTSCADSSYGDHSKHHKPCVKGKMSAQCQVFEQQHSDMEIYEEPVCADPPVDTPERCSGRKLAAIIAKADEIAEKIRVERDCEGPEGEERDHSHQKITNLFVSVYFTMLIFCSQYLLIPQAKYQQLVHLTSGQYEMPRDLEYASRFKEFGGDGHFHWCFNHQIPEKWLTDTPRHNTTANKNELNRHQLKRPMPVKLMKMGMSIETAF
ncbi:MAG: hypothetical protein ACREHG_02770 [Candidatus Saccharimonadales bacterium]